MHVKSISLMSVLACSLWAMPVLAEPVAQDAGFCAPSQPCLLARADKDDKAKEVTPDKVTGTVAEMRLASEWIGKAYQIPARVPEELMLAGHSYADILVALALMDYGASLNRVLELRQHKRWADVANEVGIGEKELPAVIQAIMAKKYGTRQPQLVRFFPDVRSGMSERMHLPSFSPTIPDAVAVDQFRLNRKEVEQVRQVMSNPEAATPEMLLKSAGRSLVVADWVIAATLAKYNPNPLEIMLMVRTGEVVEWGDIATMFNIDPRIFTSGPLAPVYAVLSGTYKTACVPSLARPTYPKDGCEDMSLVALKDEQREALRWLMSLYYKENTAENELLRQQGMNLRDEAMCLAISRLANLDLQTVLDDRNSCSSWSSLCKRYQIDMTGEDNLKAVLESY